MKLLTGVLQSALAAGVACALVLAGTTRAAAQTAEDQRTAAAGQSQGPLVLTPISQAFVLAPDVKITKVNGQTSTLVGLYGGRSFEGRVFVGGGGYWLADPRQDARMFYAGLVVGGRIIGSDRLNVNAK